MNVNVQLLPIQKKLYDSKKSVAGIYSGRSTGKTYIMSWMITLHVIQGDRVLSFSQTYKSLSCNLFQEVLNRFNELNVIPDYNKQQMSISYGKGICYGYSYENIDSCRGLTEISWLFLDELALAPANLLSVVSPCLRGNFTPQIRFCSTPRKFSVWNRVVREHMLNGEWDVFTGSMLENTFISDESKQLQLNAITNDSEYDQEILGKILDETIENCIIDLRDIPVSSRIQKSNTKYYLGVDFARFGNDSTVFIVRNEDKVVAIEKLQKADSNAAASVFRRLNRTYNFHHAYFDGTGGFSSGCYDLLKADYDFIKEINFGARGNDSTANARAMMYFNMVKAIRDGFYIDDEEMLLELKSTSYFINSSGKKQLTPKEHIKAIIGHSPDSLDALALTFYDDESDLITITPDRQKELINIMFR